MSEANGQGALTPRSTGREAAEDWAERAATAQRAREQGKMLRQGKQTTLRSRSGAYSRPS